MEQGQGWTVLQYSGQLSHDTAGAGQQALAQGRAGRAGRRRGAGLGVRGALGWRAWGARQAWGSRQGARQAGRGRAGARGWAHGARGARQAWAWPGCWMGVQARPAGPVLVHCALGSVLARFLDPVRLGIFLSHHMNTVHGKINF